jgi:N-acetylated-alpha-linked acidic dipeptidase
MLVLGYEPDSEDTSEIAEQKARDAKLAAAGGDLPLGALGSGSDYTPFLQHLGLSALSIEYRGEDDQTGVYHSSYDTFEHYVRFGDPGFAYGIAEAQTVGHVVLRMAQAPVLPLEFGDFASTVGDYLGQLRKLVEDKRKHATELARLLDQNAFTLSTDPTRALLPPAPEEAVPEVDFAPLESAVAQLRRSARAYDEAYTRLNTGELKLGVAQRRQLNRLLQGMEQKLTDPRGLPGRAWFKHFIYAPGVLTGYGVKTLPAVREAVEGARWDEASQYVLITAQVLSAYCRQLDEATRLLAGGS